MKEAILKVLESINDEELKKKVELEISLGGCRQIIYSICDHELKDSEINHFLVIAISQIIINFAEIGNKTIGDRVPTSQEIKDLIFEAMNKTMKELNS